VRVGDIITKMRGADVAGNRRFILMLYGVLLCLFLAGCGSDNPWRYSPGVPSAPAGLAAAPGSGQVALNWQGSAVASAYTIYYATSPAAIGSSGRIDKVSGSTCIVTGLANDVTYYFAITARSSSGESARSAVVSATPSAQGAFQQSDQQGTWYFNALVTGPNARWMRGAISIDAAGKVSVSTFLDSLGNTAAPAGLFTSLALLADGYVMQQDGNGFQGVLSANQYRDLLAGTATVFGDSRMLMILQKRVPGVTYSSADIKGTGKLVAGPLLYVYHQLSAGSAQEWEVASCQVGQDQSETYASINAPTPRVIPGAGSKVVSLAITADGLVTETPLPGVVPQPAALLQGAVMSADKMTIVGTATDARGAYLLRVIQLVHPPSVNLSSSDYAAGSLAGSYVFRDVTARAISTWAYGNLGIDSTGSSTVSTYLDSAGSSALPAPMAVTMDAQGSLTSAADPSFSGKLSFYGDLLVATRTDPGGASRLRIALKR
jgi:hypothetical protein